MGVTAVSCPDQEGRNGSVTMAEAVALYRGVKGAKIVESRGVDSSTVSCPMAVYRGVNAATIIRKI